MAVTTPDGLVIAPGAATEFVQREGRFWLTRLCGARVGGRGADLGPPRARGVALVRVGGRRFEGDALVFEAQESAGNAVTCVWRVGDTGLRLTTVWSVCAETGVVSRRDTLANGGDAAAVITACLARVVFPPGHYTCYALASRWSHEDQGAWQPLHAGILLRHAPGRTTEGASPYLALRRVGDEEGVVFHVLPVGNWTIRVVPVTEGGELPYAVVELGLSDENLHRTLAPGEVLQLPEILCQPLARGVPEEAAPMLHRYLLSHHFQDAKPEAPVVYNTWFDQFEILDVPRLRAQLQAAREVGCEVFVVDAGWYGAGEGNWSTLTGDWREKTDAAFRGEMRAFADEVRSVGLGFGLWMEPERFGPAAAVRREHPEWFVPVGGMARLDLEQPAARDWLRSEIGRLVETYKLAWMKIDFNFALDADASGAELARYAAAWHGILDEIRSAYPNTFFEGCASGAMRGDIVTVAHFDGHFLSDSVNPVDMLRISQGTWLRLPPGRLGRWTVVRSAGQALPRYTLRVSESPATVLTPCGALWEPSESTDLDFALLVAMPGMLGFSGDLAGLSPEHRTRIAQGIGFYKQWRRFIVGSAAYLLTPAAPLSCREGWVGVQLQAPGATTSLVFVYRLGNAGVAPRLRLQNLCPTASYALARGLEGEPVGETRGASLMEDGLPAAHLALGNHRAEVFVVEQRPEA